MESWTSDHADRPQTRLVSRNTCAPPQPVGCREPWPSGSLISSAWATRRPQALTGSLAFWGAVGVNVAAVPFTVAGRCGGVFSPALMPGTMTGFAVMVAVDVSTTVAGSFFPEQPECRDVHPATGPQTCLLASLTVRKRMGDIAHCTERSAEGVTVGRSASPEIAPTLFDGLTHQYIPATEPDEESVQKEPGCCNEDSPLCTGTPAGFPTNARRSGRLTALSGTYPFT